MNSQFFVPVTDDIIYNHPETIQGPLVPYEAGMACHEWLSIEINPDESIPLSNISDKKPSLRLAYSA